MLECILIPYLIGITFAVLIQPSELLQHYARFVNFKIKNPYIQKLLICPYCIGTWISSIMVAVNLNYVIAPLIVFNLIYFTLKNIHGYGKN